jgi:hypothetical protein
MQREGPKCLLAPPAGGAPAATTAALAVGRPDRELVVASHWTDNVGELLAAVSAVIPDVSTDSRR